MHGLDATELRTLRERLADLEDLLDREPPGPAPGTLSMVVKTVAISAYPTVAQAYYGVQEVDIGSAETEGGTGAQTAVGTSFLAYNLGSTIPTAGTLVVIDLVEGRWVFNWNN